MTFQGRLESVPVCPGHSLVLVLKYKAPLVLWKELLLQRILYGLYLYRQVSLKNINIKKLFSLFRVFSNNETHINALHVKPLEWKMPGMHPRIIRFRSSGGTGCPVGRYGSTVRRCLCPGKHHNCVERSAPISLCPCPCCDTVSAGACGGAGSDPAASIALESRWAGELHQAKMGAR